MSDNPIADPADIDLTPAYSLPSWPNMELGDATEAPCHLAARLWFLAETELRNSGSGLGGGAGGRDAGQTAKIQEGRNLAGVRGRRACSRELGAESAKVPEPASILPWDCWVEQHKRGRSVYCPRVTQAGVSSAAQPGSLFQRHSASLATRGTRLTALGSWPMFPSSRTSESQDSWVTRFTLACGIQPSTRLVRPTSFLPSACMAQFSAEQAALLYSDPPARQWPRRSRAAADSKSLTWRGKATKY